MDDNNNNSFLDKNTLLAVVITILFFVGWQQYLQNKYPESYSPQPSKKEQVLSKSTQDNSEKEKAPAGQIQRIEKTETQEIKEIKVLNAEFGNFTVALSSQGMGFQEVELNKYSDRSNKGIRFSGVYKDAGSLATFFNGSPVHFDIEKKSETVFVGTADVGGQTLIKTMTIDDSLYRVDVSLRTLGGQVKSSDEFETLIVNQLVEGESLLFMPAFEGTEFFAINDGSESRERLDKETPIKSHFKKTSLLSIGSQYFAIALRDESPIIPNSRVEFNTETQLAYAWLNHEGKTDGKKTQIELTAFIGPKKYDLLKSIHNDFSLMINYGIFSALSKPMLSLLKWFHSLFENWGLAIILLTIMIRLFLLPINLSSLRSMKKMQKIQPQLKALKEKYKDDPQRMNQETMALMKREKANPLGGCLPMLLQLPVFFALYSVLGQSVELYKSPFVFWIQDLSYKDPFFVLPVAVGGLYFLQMSITPQPMDPTQARVMKFIPIVFCFFMIAVPSGLTLYFLVNTVFGIGQQFLFQREKIKAAA